MCVCMLREGKDSLSLVAVPVCYTRKTIVKDKFNLKVVESLVYIKTLHIRCALSCYKLEQLSCTHLD